MTTTILPTRRDIPAEHTWDTESIYPTPAAWDDAAAALIERLPEISAFEGRLGEGPATLVKWLDVYQDFSLQARKLSMYAYLVYSVDTGDSEATARVGRARTRASQAAQATAFAEPELIAIGFDTLREWIEREPSLAAYQHYFDKLERQSEHVRSAEVEALLSLAGDAFVTARATHGVLTNSDLTFPDVDPPSGEPLELAQSTMPQLITHPNREVRRQAYEQYADQHLAFKQTMANCLSAGVKQDVFQMRARGYGSSLEAALAPNNIPTDVFHNLLSVFQARLPIWHRYWQVRKQAMGVETLRPYDIKAPLSRNPPAVPYTQAVTYIAEGMAPLGEEYVEALRRGSLEERWVDIYPNKGKSAGAYSYGSPGTNPFIFMSYGDDLFGLSTLAHELGHSLHFYYTWQTQPVIYSGYSMFVAEVASNFNQALVRDHLLKTQDDPAFQIAVIEEAMANFHRYFFIMPTLARFELEIHERVERGEALTADGLIDLMADLFAEGYGDEIPYVDKLDRQRSGITWGQFSGHLYANFYVFQYATGISAAHALATDILSGDADASERYLAFLKAGGSRYPIDALQAAGVDMTTPQPVEAAFDVLEGYVARLEELVS